MGGAVASAGRGLGQSELGRAWAGSQDAAEGGACLRAGAFGTVGGTVDLTCRKDVERCRRARWGRSQGLIWRRSLIGFPGFDLKSSLVGGNRGI